MVSRIRNWTNHHFAVTAVLAVLWPAAVAAQSAGESVDRELHLLRRATFGVRPADIEEARSLGVEAWLDRQLAPSSADDAALEARIARFPAATKSIAELVRDYTPPRRQPRDSMAGRAAMTREERRMRAESNPARILLDMTGAKLVRAVWSDRQLEEIMTDFWFNHFNVYFGKGLDRYLVADYERTAIRANVFGRFEDMLLATAQHPAMLFYLDNWTNFAPDSMSGARDLRMRRDMLDRLSGLTPSQRERMIRSGRITRAQLDRLERMNEMMAQRPQRERGINENYARELLELHTVGVDGGYTQADVIAVARAFTGWTFVPPANRQNARAARRPGAGEAGTFQFRLELHDIGGKTVLGQPLESGRGIEDGRDVIHLLATHPSTARHIATKLIERFVSDSPDPLFVDELAAVFTRTDGDLREVTRALFASSRFYDASNVGTKVKTPFELVASALRVTWSDVSPSPRLLSTLRDLGQLPYDETAPTGYPAASEDWINAGAMLNRMNFALDLASGRFPGIRPDGQRFGPGPNQSAEGAVTHIVDVLIPGVPADDLVSAIQEDLAARIGVGEETRRALGARVVGLTLGSPQFQRR